MMKRVSALLIGAVIVAGLSQAASAAIIQIQLGGVDITYDGTSVSDSGTTKPDSLTNATFLSDGTVMGVDTTLVTLDLNIPGVDSIPATGGQVQSDLGGSLNLDLGDGEFLELTLDESVVSYIPSASIVQFVFVGATSTIDDQKLPYGITFTDPVAVSFSTQVSGVVPESGGYITGFSASGTGELRAVPEPAALAILGLGTVGMLVRRRRKQSA